jgi:hypothetical protein
MNKYMRNLVLLNCKLIEEDVRECFLFWCKKTHKIKDLIKIYFPNLYLNEHIGITLYNFPNCDTIFVSKRYIHLNEVDTKAKVGKLLGYLSADNFEQLNRNEIAYSYTFYAYVDNKGIALFNEISQIKLDHSKMLNKIKKLLENKQGIYTVDKVMLEERIMIPN